MSIAQAPLWGMGRVAALELPARWGGMIDLDATEGDDRSAALLLAEIEDPQGEDQTAFRAGRRLVARLVPSPDRASRSVTIRSDAAYLVTGGLGALGLHVARTLVERGARHLVLVGRHGSRAAAEVEALERAGAQVTVVEGDVSRREDVARAIAAASAPLCGVVHAAGTVRLDSIEEMTAESLDEVFRGKAGGAWWLHELTRDLPLDFFVMFSSIAAVWGSARQAHYAAANAFLDALAGRAPRRRACRRCRSPGDHGPVAACPTPMHSRGSGSAVSRRSRRPLACAA